MIAMIIGILKWIGILLLALFGLILAILLIVLLVPIRYRVQGSRSAEGGLMSAKGKVSWLLSILAVTFSYEQEFSWKVRIFGIPLKIGQQSENDDAEDLTEEQLAQITELEAELEVDSKTDQGFDWKKDQQENTAWTPKTESQLTLQTQEADMDREYQEIPSAKETGSGSWKEKIQGGVRKIQDTFRAIPKKITDIKEKIQSLKEKAHIWHDFLKSDEVQQLFIVCKKQISQILRHLIPTRFHVQGNYGFEDPSLTGKITGFIYALPPKYQKCFQVQPHFQEECLDGEVVLQGRIRLGSLVWTLIRILVKPCAWKAFKKYRAITKPQKKRSGRSGDSHKKNTKNKKSDPHKGGK